MHYVYIYMQTVVLIKWNKMTKYNSIDKDKHKHKFDYYNDDFYHSSAWQAIRKQALLRDCYTCVICRSHGRYTFANTVHHIKPIRANTSLKEQLSNLLTVCSSCHNQLHTEKRKNLHEKKKLLKAYSKNYLILKNNPEIY